MTARIPRLAITERDLGPSTRDALAASFALVLQKPIGLRYLLDAIERLLAAQPRQA